MKRFRNKAKPTVTLSRWAQALVLLFVIGCATTARVSTTTSPGVNLSVYKTFMLTTHPANAQEPLQTEVTQRLETEIIAQLLAHGLKATTTNPDLVFSYRNGRRTHTESAGFGNGFSDEEWTYQEGAVDVSAVDARNTQTVWTAHAQAVIDPRDKSHLQIKKAIEKVFSHYPQITPTQ